MKIDFYEEFPTKRNLEKLKLIKFPCRLFIAARSTKEFEKASRQVDKINKKIETVYWPIIKNSYWISPFSNTKDLIELFNELDKTKYPILIDLEPPMLNKILFIKNLPYFLKNKRLINDFLERNKRRVTTFGLGHKILVPKQIMFYTSMLSKRLHYFMRRNLEKIKNKEDYIISLGTIAKGIFNTELRLHPKNLHEDLQLVKKLGFNKVVIFRLGGLDKIYIRVINTFVKKGG
jgi:hypothetical protein